MAEEDALRRPGFAVRWAGSLAVVRLPVEVDIANEREVDEELGALLGMEPSVLVVDMSQTRFCDSSGIAALIRAWKRAQVLGTGFRLAGPRDSIMRVLRLLGAHHLLEIYPDLDAALPEETQAS